MLLEDESIDYKQLTSLTDAGQAKLDEQRVLLGVQAAGDVLR